MAQDDVAQLHVQLAQRLLAAFGAQLAFPHHQHVPSCRLQGLGIDQAEVKATDKGALDCTIRARVTAAAVRATGKDVWAD